MAEKEGFEPSIPVKVYQISSLAHSTTLPPLRNVHRVYPTQHKASLGGPIVAGKGLLVNGLAFY